MSSRLESALQAAYTCFEAGDVAAAESACSEILRKSPRNAGALHLLGTLRLRLGDAGAACELYAKVARLRPGDDRVLESLANAQLAVNGYGAAEATLVRAIKVAARPRASLHVCLAYALTALGRHDEAERELRAALRTEPANPEVLTMLGNALAQRGRTDEARQFLARAADLEPHRPDASFNLALLLERDGRHEEAARAYGAISARFPDYPDALINLGVVYERLGRHADAIRSYEQALAIDSRSVSALTNLAKVLTAERRLKEAKAACLQALRIQPDSVDALVNHATALVGEGDADAALREYEKALGLNPDAADVHLGYAVLNLALGNFTKGWLSYAHRPTRRRARQTGIRLDSTLPQSLEGKAVLMLGEQGMGDELFFLRYSCELRSRGARLHAQCHPALATLLRRTQLYESVLIPDEPAPPADHVVLEGDLPLLLRIDSCPPPLALDALEDRVRRLRESLASLGPAPHIGLTWRAGTPPALQSDRPDRALYKEVPFEVLAAGLKAVPGTLVALQRDPAPGELERLSTLLSRPVYDLTQANRDLEDMLALLAAIDDYIGVSNTNMHLMAGLGRAARVLVPHPPEWRWMWGAAHTPWFPAFAVYRQTPGCGWDRALRELNEDLLAANAGNKLSRGSVDLRDGC